MIRFVIVATTTLLPFASLAVAQEHERPAADTKALGQTSFSTSCASEVRQDFDRAVAMLHSFWYQAAEQAFGAIAREDPSCAMAYWGVAMSRFRQLWGTPGPDDVEAAQAALEKARRAESTSEREQAYLAALERFYRDADRVDHLERVVAYEGAMRELHERYPDDSEAAIFHALALLAIASASPPDRTFARQNEAAAILAGILPEQPDHPGVAHYLIHSSDYPPLAGRALEAARRYAEIAPGAPHALHMPSHIFTRLGLWQESIVSNQAASAAAREDGWIGEELHTTDYLAYAYLQGAQDREAERILDMLPERSAELSSDGTNYSAGLYATAAIPARFAVERRRWTEAAAPLHLARGLGAVHTGDLEAARRAMEELEGCRALLLGAGEAAEASGVNVGLWSNRLEMQRLGVEAWLALAEGREEEALALMRSAADLEDGGDKPPTTPGSVVPARELLGEMLLEVGRPADALAEFEGALGATPNRFRSLYGAARAADLAGEVERARQYYAKLLEVSRWAEGERPESVEAKRFLARERTGG